jgi:hypothetical protein
MKVSMSWPDMAFCFMPGASHHHRDVVGCTGTQLLSIFVERSSTKECTCQPPPPHTQIRKQMQTFKRVRSILQFYIKFYSAAMQFYIFYKFTIFKLRSTTEQMPALVFLQSYHPIP